MRHGLAVILLFVGVGGRRRAAVEAAGVGVAGRRRGDRVLARNVTLHGAR